MKIAAQIFGFMGLGCNIVCYQLNEKKKLLFVQILASVLFTLNMLLQGKWAGMLLSAHAIVRLLFYAARERHRWMQSRLWILFFVLTAGLCSAVTYQSPLDLLPLVGTVFTVVSFALPEPRFVRLVTIPSPPCWFTYHLFSRNYSGMLNEAFIFGSILVGMLRHDFPAFRAASRRHDEKPL